MHQEIIRRRHLPHWDVPDATYFVTACLEGSLPAQGVTDLSLYRKNLRNRAKPIHQTEEAWKEHKWKLEFSRAERWLDNQPANRALEDPLLSEIVIDSMYFFAGQRYDLLAFVVMPSHIHWLFYPLPKWIQGLNSKGPTPRQKIMYSFKRFTATRCNKLRNCNGPFWQVESYDHWVRDADELERIIHYIEENPVKAGLVKTPEQWKYSSAHWRLIDELKFGEPLSKPESLAHSLEKGMEGLIK